MASRGSQQKRDLPFHSLGVGLRNQDIIKVSTFCKSMDSDFHQLLAKIIEAKAVSPAQMPLCYNGITLDLYQGGLQLVMTCVIENTQKHRHLQFVQSLLQLLQDHLSRGIKQVMTNLKKVQMENLSSKEIEKQTDDLLTTMTDHMMSVREQSSVLQKVLQKEQERQQQQPRSRERRPSVGSLSSFRDGILGIGAGSSGGGGGGLSIEGGVTDEQRERLVTWDSLDERAVIAEGILIGELPFLQKYLTQRFGPDTAEWMNIINTGLSETLIFLQEKEMKYAKKMLQNMGFDARTKLRSMCFYTPERSLRDYLASELHTMGGLTEEERDMLKFVHRLEHFYSCPSFKMCKILRTEDTEGEPFPDPLHLTEVLPQQKVSSVKDCEDLVEMDVHNSETSHYGHVLIEWIRSWDVETRQRIILDQALYKTDLRAELMEDIPAAVIWNYLCTRQDIRRLREWIDTQHPIQNKEVLVEPSWPFNLPIEKHLVDNITGATGFTKEAVLNELARRGIFSTKEQVDFEALTARLRKIQGLFSRPHIIERSDDPTVVAMQDLHRHFIQFCMEKELPELLYFYLDYWRLCVDSTKMEHFHLEKRIPPWVEMMLHFRKASSSLFDPESVFEASLACSRCVHMLNITSIEQMIEEGLIGTALATLMFSQEKLQQFLADPPEKAKQGLMSLPTLYQALFDKETSSETIGISTVYQILQGNIPFNPSRLFGWQSTHNNVAEDAVTELPHFSNETLAKKYGHKEHLQFSYFLKQGRPCFAFCNFVLEEVQSTGAGQLSSKSIEKVCLRVHWLGLKYFSKPQITAACAVFMEMLGSDSTVFRVHVQAANQITAYKLKESPQGLTLEEKRHHEQKVKERIVCDFHLCLRSPDSHSEEILSALEEATGWSISKAHFPRLSFEAEQRWLLVLAFCKCHSLQFTNKFLEACAKENDWLKFMTHAQCYQYPPKQVQAVTSYFTNSVISEHLSFIINNMCEVELRDSQQSPKVLYKRDFRARLYARVGVAKKDLKSDQSSSEDEELGLDHQDLNAEADTIEQQEAAEEEVNSVEVRGDNLFDLLLCCQRTTYPSRSLCTYCIKHRNPVLAVLAGCFKERNLLDCLCSWLYAALGHMTSPDSVTAVSDLGQSTARTGSPGNNLEPDMSKTSWSLRELLDLVLTGLYTSSMATVYDGFYIFFPDTVMLPFLKFVAKFSQQESIQGLKGHLAQFTQWMQKKKSADETLDCRLFPIGWIEDLVLAVIKYMICEMTVEDAGKALQLVDETHLIDRIADVTTVLPDFSLLNKLYVMIRNTGIHVNFKVLMESHTASFHNEWANIISALQNKKYWKEARVAAELLGHPTKDITLQQLHTMISELKQNDIWRYEEVQREFWKEAESLLQRHETDVFVATEFFQEQGNKSIKSSAKEYLYQLAYKWLSKAEVDTIQSQGLFTQIWKSKIQGLLEKLKQESPESPPAQLTREVVSLNQIKRQHLDTGQLRKLTRVIPSPQASCTEESLTDEEEGALGLLLNDMLDKGAILEAQKIAAHFRFPSTDLNIILTCHKLASQNLKPDSLDVSMRRLISSSSLTSSMTRHRKSSVQMVSLPRTGSSLSISSRLNELSECVTEEESVLSCIQLLSKHCKHGRQCCDVIQAAYHMAKVLDIDYIETLAVNEFNLLNHLMKCEFPERYLLAKAYTQAVAIPDDQVAGFLCNIVVETLKVQLGIIPGSENRPTLASLRSGISSNSLLKGGLIISEIIQLCENPAVLGQCLLNQVMSTTSSEVNPSLATLSMEVELLIYAHDCFTLACHMEGISDVLRTCKTVTSVLNQAEEFTLMVRLLTGVGRYSEMVYVLDILKQQHQFELLFRKGTDKENKLKLALLDYLQRYHPEDVETYTMAALHFTMYREISQMQEKAAAKLLNSLSGRALENTSENQDDLHKALHSLSDAAENYVKVNCLRHAEDCVKKAKLVALQLQFLTSRTRIVNLDTDALRLFIRSHKKVHEVYIVLEAYNQPSLWSEAVYCHVVRQGDYKYLTELAPYIKLTATLVTDIAERFRSEGHQNKQTSVNLHKLLLQCCDVKTALKLAKSLDMKDALQELLKGPDGAYLKDSFQL